MKFRPSKYEKLHPFSWMFHGAIHGMRWMIHRFTGHNKSGVAYELTFSLCCHRRHPTSHAVIAAPTGPGFCNRPYNGTGQHSHRYSGTRIPGRCGNASGSGGVTLPCFKAEIYVCTEHRVHAGCGALHVLNVSRDGTGRDTDRHRPCSIHEQKNSKVSNG